MIVLVIFFSFPFFLCADSTKKTIQKLDLRDGVIINNIKIKDLLPEDPKVLADGGKINAIKNNALMFVNKPVTNDDMVIMETSHGTIKLELYPEKAPNHCNNFKKLANSGFYDKTIFHRIIPGFMIQGGDILTRDSNPDNDGTGNPGWTIDQEFNDIRHERGILSMARSQDVNSAGSQFFICVDQAYHLDLKYTVFGKVIENEFILDIITKIPSESKQILNDSKTKIPEGELSENWLEYSFGGKKWFIKKPELKTKEQFGIDVRKRLKNKHRTHVPVIINKVRVVDTNTYIEGSNTIQE